MSEEKDERNNTDRPKDPIEIDYGKTKNETKNDIMGTSLFWPFAAVIAAAVVFIIGLSTIVRWIFGSVFP